MTKIRVLILAGLLLTQLTLTFATSTIVNPSMDAEEINLALKGKVL